MQQNAKHSRRNVLIPQTISGDTLCYSIYRAYATLRL